MEGTWGRQASLHSGVWGASPLCTVTWWMYAVLPSSSWNTCPSRSFSPGDVEAEKWTRLAKVYRMLARFGTSCPLW